MAKRGQRKTSLGNPLDSDNKITGGRDKETTGRWRSCSDAGQQQSRQKLFGSLREAMEHEAAKEKACKDVDVASTIAFLDARTLSTLEQTQADEAGYTVIRSRALSDVGDVGTHFPRVEQYGLQGRGSDQRGKKSSRGKRREEASGGHIKPSSSTNGSSVRESKTKRTQPQPLRPHQSKLTGTPHEPWRVAVDSRSSDSCATNNSPASPAECSSDAQRWLEAASSGAVHPAAPLPPPSPRASAGSKLLRIPEWDTSIVSAMWPCGSEIPSDETQDSRESLLPHQQTEEAAADGASSAASEELPEAMLTWLDSKLSLDATRSSSPLSLH